MIKKYGNLFSRKIDIKYYTGKTITYKMGFEDSIFKMYSLPEKEAFIYIDGKYQYLNSRYLSKVDKIDIPIYDAFYVKNKLKEIKKKQEAIINNNLPKLYFSIRENGTWITFSNIVDVIETNTHFHLITMKNTKEKESILISNNNVIRTNYYEYNKELLVSPRATINFILSPKHSITLSWGYYYQPPYYSELRNKEVNTDPKLNDGFLLPKASGPPFRSSPAGRARP